MLSEELILHFLPKLFKKYEIKEKSLLRITRNADIDTETIWIKTTYLCREYHLIYHLYLQSRII